VMGDSVTAGMSVIIGSSSGVAAATASSTNPLAPQRQQGGPGGGPGGGRPGGF
jgi:hypothetical protein